jgi:hypothetical protein
MKLKKTDILDGEDSISNNNTYNLNLKNVISTHVSFIEN